MLNLNTIYNYYTTQYVAPKYGNNNRSKNHDKDELKTVYKNMVKQNQTSPFYKFAFTDDTQMYAIGIKEAAMSLEADSKSLGSRKESVFHQMAAVSENENVIYASLNDNDTGDLPDTLSIQVDSLATGQTNVGNYLPSGESSFTPGEYTFGITVGSNSYTFNLNIHNDDTNLQIQRNLAGAINENNIGVHASIRNNRMDGTSALVLRSDTVGLSNNDDLLFRFEDGYVENDITSALGVDHVESAPSNAQFYINDVFHSSISNRISLNHAMDIDLLSTSESPVNVHIVPDEDKISDKLSDFVKSYNTLIDMSRSGTSKQGATRLYRDVTNITRHHSEALAAAGLKMDAHGYLSLSEESDSSEVQSLFDDEISSFRKEIKRATDKMSLNPLDYIDKTVVTYPNTTNTYPNPYQPSKYSGLLFNDYA